MSSSRKSSSRKSSSRKSSSRKSSDREDDHDDEVKTQTKIKTTFKNPYSKKPNEAIPWPSKKYDAMKTSGALVEIDTDPIELLSKDDLLAILKKATLQELNTGLRNNAQFIKLALDEAIKHKKKNAMDFLNDQDSDALIEVIEHSQILSERMNDLANKKMRDQMPKVVFRPQTIPKNYEFDSTYNKWLNPSSTTMRC